MRHFARFALVLGLATAFVGCPPPEEDGEEAAAEDEAEEKKPREFDPEQVEAAPDSVAQELGHVVVGQEYFFTKNAPMPNIEETWTIARIVKNREIHYTLRSKYDVHGDLHNETSNKIAAIPPNKPDGEELDESKTFTVSGVKFECTGYETEDGVTTWFSNAFPFTIKRFDVNGEELFSLDLITAPKQKDAKKAAKKGDEKGE